MDQVLGASRREAHQALCPALAFALGVDASGSPWFAVTMEPPMDAVPPNRLAVCCAVVVCGLLPFPFTRGVAVFVAPLPAFLGLLGVYHALRSIWMKDDATRLDEAQDHGKRALHFAVFSFSMTGLFAVIALLAMMLLATAP